jgi:hypothetical protein
MYIFTLDSKNKKMEQKKIDNQIFDAENEVKIVFQSNNNFIFALDANNLYAENYGLIKTLSYNEIYSVRLDFHKSEIREYNPRRVDYFIQYSCFINENLEIAFVATLKIIWETMPESYAPSKIPTRFLP